MNETKPNDEELVRRVLSRCEPSVQAPEEMDLSLCEDAAVLLEGGLSAKQAEQLHLVLDDNPSLRQAISITMSEKVDDTPAISIPLISRWPRYASAFAIAASIALVFTVLLWLDNDGRQLAEARVFEQTVVLLSNSQFKQVRSYLDEARSEGIESDRLRNLEVQAQLEIPAVVALSYNGQLSDYGYTIGGMRARSTDLPSEVAEYQSAYDLLSKDGATQIDIFLNRGYLLLNLQEYASARDAFRQAIKSGDKPSLSWLGVGLSEYLLENHVAAAEAFETAIKADSGMLSAYENLAMTRTELGDYEGAVVSWRKLLSLAPDHPDRLQIREQISELEKL